MAKSSRFTSHISSDHSAELDGLHFVFHEDYATLVHVEPRLIGHLVVPNRVSGLPVLAVQAFAFARTGVSRVCLPRKLALIGSYAFLECRNLVDVEIEASALETVGADPFAGCDALHQVRVTGHLSFGGLMLSVTHPGVRFVYEDAGGRTGAFRITVSAISA